MGCALRRSVLGYKREIGSIIFDVIEGRDKDKTLSKGGGFTIRF